MLYKLIIPGELVDLNTYINAERRNRFLGAKIKKQETEKVEALALHTGKVTVYPISIKYTWYTKNSRKDADNIAFQKKFIQDGLVKAGVIIDDSRKYIASYKQQEFFVDKENPRIEIEIYPHT